MTFAMIPQHGAMHQNTMLDSSYFLAGQISDGSLLCTQEEVPVAQRSCAPRNSSLQTRVLLQFQSLCVSLGENICSLSLPCTHSYRFAKAALELKPTACGTAQSIQPFTRMGGCFFYAFAALRHIPQMYMSWSQLGSI